MRPFRRSTDIRKDEAVAARYRPASTRAFPAPGWHKPLERAPPTAGDARWPFALPPTRRAPSGAAREESESCSQNKGNRSERAATAAVELRAHACFTEYTARAV